VVQHLWVEFSGEYSFLNTGSVARRVTFTLPFPAARATYDAVAFSVNGKPQEPEYAAASANVTADVAAGETAVLRVAYRSRGLDQWSYAFGQDVSRVRDFQLTLATNFDGFDFPDNTLSPTQKRQAAGGWELVWEYSNLVSGVPISVALPQKLQPGPLAGQISFFAPVSLFFFFFLMFIITTLRQIELHPMNYFFLAGAFFAFHLLLAYLVDHTSIHAAFVICSLVSVFLVVSYLRLVVGMRFAAVEAALSQFIYLVLFSYAFFFEGFTGLAITIGAILTLFVVMQVTGRIRWAEQFAPKPARA
jgi:inner membrane protein involved in colicin E2 resistance